MVIVMMIFLVNHTGTAEVGTVVAAAVEEAMEERLLTASDIPISVMGRKTCPLLALSEQLEMTQTYKLPIIEIGTAEIEIAV